MPRFQRCVWAGQSVESRCTPSPAEEEEEVSEEIVGSYSLCQRSRQGLG